MKVITFGFKLQNSKLAISSSFFAMRKLDQELQLIVTFSVIEVDNMLTGKVNLYGKTI
jgi:hypothetical protein